MVSLEFDPRVNALYIGLREGKVVESDPVSDNIVVDLGDRGQVLGIELLLPKTLDRKITESIVAVVRGS